MFMFMYAHPFSLLWDAIIVTSTMHATKQSLGREEMIGGQTIKCTSLQYSHPFSMQSFSVQSFVVQSFRAPLPIEEPK